MTRMKKQTPRSVLALFMVTALLAISLLLIACGARANSNSSSSLNGSNISTAGTTQLNTPGGLQGANQQVQTAVSAVDGAHNDVNSADSSSNNDDGQQP